MWALDNQTKYAAERNWVRDGRGAHLWLVAVRATFDVGIDGRLSLADEQPAPLLEPEHYGDPATTSLRFDSDLLARKPGTDVVLDANAHAPRGRAARSVVVSLRIGAVRKSLVVYGPRRYRRSVFGLTTSSSKPFTEQPIHYEHAFGGADLTSRNPRKQRIDARNPIGLGFTLKRRRLVGTPAHTIEYPKGKPARSGPAGFGPIASSWSPRRELAGTYDARWERAKKPLLPDDYDERFALCAPADQRPARPLRGGEPVELVNLTPEGSLRFELPKIYLSFSSHFGRRAVPHQALLSCVAIVPDQRKLSLVWQSSLPVAKGDVDYLDETTISEKPYLS